MFDLISESTWLPFENTKIWRRILLNTWCSCEKGMDIVMIAMPFIEVVLKIGWKPGC